jgi:hypothetical protein
MPAWSNWAGRIPPCGATGARCHPERFSSRLSRNDPRAAFAGPYVEEEHDELINTGGRYATVHRVQADIHEAR